jgi:hypothetical protein
MYRNTYCYFKIRDTTLWLTGIVISLLLNNLEEEFTNF